MAFTNDEIIKLTGNVLAAGVIDSSPNSWYEKLIPNKFIIDPSSIWTDLPALQEIPADNFAGAVTNANNHPDLIGLQGINTDGTFNDATALRLKPVAGTNKVT